MGREGKCAPRVLTGYVVFGSGSLTDPEKTVDFELYADGPEEVAGILTQMLGVSVEPSLLRINKVREARA